VQEMLSATEKLSEKTDCPLHLWLTEAWWSMKWLVSSSAALGILLQKWIGDTIRISLTPQPWQSRSDEVYACKYLLQSMWFRNFQPIVTSCPGCWRTTSDRFQKLAKQVSDEINIRLPEWKKKYSWFENTKIAVMGCVVNWVGEATNADVGIFFPWNSENPRIPVYVKGKQYKFLEVKNVFENFMEIVEIYLKEKI
jgi:(E)-4-hydroxy-3-methylbut-2-enyl-diphosphate synthase